MNGLKKVRRKKQKAEPPKKPIIESSDLSPDHVEQQMNNLRSLPFSDKQYKLLCAVKQAIRFCELRGYDKDSSTILEYYLVKSQLFFEKQNAKNDKPKKGTIEEGKNEVPETNG